MRVQGRLLRPATLAERRLLKSIGIDFIRVPRKYNPFAVARLVRRMSFGGADMPKLRTMVMKRPEPRPVPAELPDSTPEPRDAERAA